MLNDKTAPKATINTVPWLRCLVIQLGNYEPSSKKKLGRHEVLRETRENERNHCNCNCNCNCNGKRERERERGKNDF